MSNEAQRKSEKSGIKKYLLLAFFAGAGAFWYVCSTLNVIGFYAHFNCRRGVCPSVYLFVTPFCPTETTQATACGQKCVTMAAAQTLDSFFAS